MEVYPYVVYRFAAVQSRSSPGASMTLVGLLPPLCDNGHMHVDGGYSEHLVSYARLMLKKFSVDNLPVRAT